MFKYLNHRLSVITKAFALFAGLCTLLYILSRYLYSQIEQAIETEYGLVIDKHTILDHIHLQPISLIITGCILLFALFIIDISLFSKRINKEIKESLEERKLNHNFNHFFTSMNFDQIIQHINAIFSLYKSLDNLKTSRIILEVGTIKQLINNVSKGILLVNKDLVVTHANHVIEDMLGLIPGEIIGEAISRQISNEPLLTALEKAFEFDQKFTNHDLKENDLEAVIIPLKDKFGDIIRALIMVSKKSDSPKTSSASRGPK